MRACCTGGTERGIRTVLPSPPVADREREREHLAATDRHIAQVRASIARQRELIQQLTWDGHETELAEEMLQALEHTLAAFESHRAIILDRLDNMPDSS
jgi:hypothetical protein